ncbi:uncharacterized protein LOC143254041 isoform X2 [Tachypleus tridentatus]|uniref:uncharacterized protein LOC143254041 isoform X2 n=1 Tax=Tachypleus tridentatus TaxID=6853 RepID=UPI003FCFCECD
MSRCSGYSQLLVVCTFVMTLIERSSCVIDCGFVIYNNPNGKVVHVNGTTTFGSVLQLRCNEGYKVVGGQNIMVCQNNSRWSNINLHCAEISCGLAQTPDNGVWIPTNKSKTTAVGTVMKLSCKRGRAIPPQHATIRCQPNGTWTPVMAVCAGNGRSTMSSTKLIATVIGLFLLAVLMVTVVVMLKKRKQQLKYAAHTNRTRTFLYRPSKEIGAFLYIKSSGSGQYLNLLEEDIEEENAEDSMTRRPLPPDSISDQHSSVEVLEQHNQYKIPT